VAIICELKIMLNLCPRSERHAKDATVSHKMLILFGRNASTSKRGIEM
jgi:hypothetical protein